MTLYLLNSPVLTAWGDYRFSPLSADAARALVSEGFESGIGHSASAELLAALLQVPVRVNRCRVTMQAGDRAVVLRMLERVPEGKVLDRSELRDWPHELALLERLRGKPEVVHGNIAA